MSNSPTFQDSVYTKYQSKIFKLDDFRNGVDSVKKRLTKWERETEEAYKARQDIAVLYNVVKRTVETTAGMLFRKEITWSDDLNALFVKRTENIDGNDTELNEFMKESATNSLWYGISFILVDMPENDEPIASFQQQLDRGIIPYFTHITPKQILNRRVSNGVLTQITIDENITVYDGDFGEEVINQQRVLFIGGGRIYRDDEIVYEWTNNLKYIPIVPVYTAKTAFLEGTPKFDDLANLNLKHFNLMSQLDKSLFVASNPIPVIYGHRDDDSLTIGVDQALVFSHKEDGGFEWVEFAGTSIDKLQEEIKNTEARMNSAALSMLTQSNNDKSATEAAIIASTEQSDVSAIATSIEWSANVAYRYWCDMMAQQPSGEITTNKDFAGIALTPDQARIYLDMYNSGTLSMDELWNALQSKEFLQEFDRELVKAEIEARNQTVSL